MKILKKVMTIFYHTSRNKKKFKLSGKLDLNRTICLVLTGLLMLQVFSPGVAFCLKEGNRVIQCQSAWASFPEPVLPEITGSGCCNKACKEKLPEDEKIQNHSSSEENDKNSCCISLHVEHEGVICLSHSDLDVSACGVVFDSIKPFVNTSGFPLNSAIEKPPSLASLRTVVLIL